MYIESPEPYYQPATAGKGKVDPPLAPHQSLTIGYGAAGSAPYTYYLRPGQDVDVGFLKLFLTTEYVDLSCVTQESSFRTVTQPRTDMEVQSTAPLWGTVMVTVVQRA